MARSDERGFAIVMAMFMALMVSALGAAMTYVARTETESSASYTTMAQARYGAESGLAAAANYLLSSAYTDVAPGSLVDPVLNYNLETSPVSVLAGGTVMLSSEPGASIYPVASVVTAFGEAASGTLSVGNGTIEYGARATLLSMREFTDTISGDLHVLQSWEITGVGRRGGAGSAEVEVSAIIERRPVPVFRYAAFATGTECQSLEFVGNGSSTSSYSSMDALGSDGYPITSTSDGNVGTNGNLTMGGGSESVVWGTLSTPRTGVGECTDGGETALEIEGKASVSGGLLELPQIVEYPTPPEPSPLPPTTAVSFTRNGGCPIGVLLCSASGGVTTITPLPNVPYVLGNVSIEAQADLVLHAGTYIVNSIYLTGNSKITVAGDGPVIFQVAGQDHSTPISLAGNGVTNTTFDPSNLQFIYGGEGDVYVSGGTNSAQVVYAPNANVVVAGNSTYYGAIVANTMEVGGNAHIRYDRNLARTAQTTSNPVLSTFTWHTF